MPPFLLLYLLSICYLILYPYLYILPYSLPHFRLCIDPPDNCQGNSPITNRVICFTFNFKFKRNHLPLGPCHLLYYSNKEECILFGKSFGKGSHQSTLTHFDSLPLGARTLRPSEHWEGRSALTKRLSQGSCQHSAYFNVMYERPLSH